jgi:hypothetical protein
MRYIESKIQVAGVRAARNYLVNRWPGYCLLLERGTGKKKRILLVPPFYCVENEGKRDDKEQGRAILMGLVSGVWDLTLEIPIDKYAGLKIEVKRPKVGRLKAGALSHNQKVWEKHYKFMKYKTEICYSAQEILDAVINYMECK